MFNKSNYDLLVRITIRSKCIFGFTVTTIDFEWIDFDQKWIEGKMIYVWIYYVNRVQL